MADLYTSTPADLAAIQAALAIPLAPISGRKPGINDGTSRGQAVGDYWADRRTGALSKALDVTAGAAVWQPVIEQAAHVVNAIGGVAPVAAYGMVKLVGAYAGSALQIQRASDSTTLDVGFVTVNIPGLGPTSVVDAAAMDDFLVGTTGGVSKWYDQSGAGNDAVQATAANQPQVLFNTINGLRTLSIGNDRLSVPTNYFLTMPAGVAVNRNALTLAIAGRMGGGAAIPVEFGAATNYFSVYLNNAAGGVTTGVWAFNDTSPQQTTCRLHSSPGFLAIKSASGITAYSNNESATSAARSAQAITGGAIGASPRFGAGFTAKSQFLAMLVYARGLTAGETEIAKTWCMKITGAVPQIDSQVVYLGDSITVGTGPKDVVNRPLITDTLLSRPALLMNYGVDGSTAAQWATGVSAASYYRSAYRKNVAMVHLGTNDITAGTTGAATYASLVTIWAALRAVGFKVVASTVLPRSAFSAGQQTEWAALNTLIRANYATLTDGLADFQLDPTIGPFAAASDAALYVDGTHPSAKGYEIMANIEAVAINALLGLPQAA